MTAIYLGHSPLPEDGENTRLILSAESDTLKVEIEIRKSKSHW